VISDPGDDRAFIERSVRLAIIGAAALGVVVAALWVLKGALTPLAAALVIAYLFDPLIDRFEARGFSRGGAILVLLTAVGAALFGVAFVLIPALQRDITSLSERLPGDLERALSALGPRIERDLGIALPRTIHDAIEGVRSGEIQLPLEAMRALLERILHGVTGTVGALVSLVVIPVLAYYLLVEFDRIRLALLDLVPRAHQGAVASGAARIDALISGFIRGQLTVCLALGVLYAIGFAAIGIDLAIAIGVASGLLAIIPYVGGAVALVSSTAMALLRFGVGAELALVIGWYLVVQTLESFVLTPRIVGKSLGMHPVTVIVALMIGGDLLGFLGLLVAVPLAAVIQVFAQDLVARYRESSFYGPPPSGAGRALADGGCAAPTLAWRADDRPRTRTAGTQ
jgi:predicted PurR-regulated permease PerM